ncbi:MAG: hypothetical protein RBS13_02760 [Bacteroidales bacterium]|jgi:hypothetical protein|nr:hypothetical protein [Bacteroidales bacterium]
MTNSTRPQIQIKEVINDKDLRLFIRFPKHLYKHCPYYVPSLESEDWKTLKHHPAKAFCEIRMWLAFQDTKAVGRIAGIINHKCNALKQQQRIRFAWFDTINDTEVASALFNVVENWGREQKLLEISGPSRFSNMEKQGMLIYGFNRMPPISAEYNFPYYPQILENLDYQKEVDYIQYKVAMGPIPEKITRLYEYISKKHKVKIQEFKHKKDMIPYGKKMFLALNQSYSDIYNFIPLSDTEIDYMIKNNFIFLDKDLVNILVDENNKMVGFSLCMPSLSKAFRKANGKLFPFGWYHLLKAMQKNDEVDLYFTGVLPQHSGKGFHLLYHYKLHTTFIKKGYVFANATQQLEYNAAHHIWEEYDSKIVFKRRCYLKNLHPLIK